MRYASCIALISIIVVLNQPSPAVSGNFLQEAVDDFIAGARSNTTQPGVYKGQTREYFVGGRFTFRPRLNQEPIIGFSPPRLAMSCSGIDASLGGLSYINLSRMVDKLKNMSSAMAYGFLIGLAYTVPSLKGVLDTIEQAVNMINSISKNACQAGQAIGQSFATAIKERYTNDAALKRAETGSSQDFTEAVRSAAQGLADAKTQIPMEYNLVWYALTNSTSLDTETKEWLMSVTGSYRIKLIDNMPNPRTIIPLIQPEEILQSDGQTKRYSCAGSVAPDGCLDPVAITDATFKGMYDKINQELRVTLDDIRDGRAIPATQQNFLGSTKYPILKLMKWVITIKDPIVEYAIIDRYSNAVALDIAKTTTLGAIDLASHVLRQADYPEIVKHAVQEQMKERREMLTELFKKEQDAIDVDLDDMRKAIEDIQARFTAKTAPDMEAITKPERPE